MADRVHLAQVPRAFSYGAQYVQYTAGSFAGTAEQYRGLVQGPSKPWTSHRTRTIKGTKGVTAALLDFGLRMQAKVEDRVKEAAFAGLVELVGRTPVKTGNARTNWRAGLGKLTAKLITPPATKSPGTNAQVATARAMIEGANVIKRFKTAHKSILIGNPVGYIGDLDTGSSRQAPAGMTLFALQAARNILKKGWATNG